MSCNQLMVLYRGTFEGTLQQDLTFLRSNELINADNSLSKKGRILIDTILKIASFSTGMWSDIEESTTSSNPS